MSQILSGKIVRESLVKDIKNRLQNLGFVPKLAIVQVGNRDDSTAFIKAKMSFGKNIGINTTHIHLSENISEPELISEIKRLNEDSVINAIIVQLPIPAHLNRDNVLNSISPKKDADALSGARVKVWSGIAEENKNFGNMFFPATPRGVRELLDFYDIDLNNKKVTIVGRSDLVGKPTAFMCKNKGAIVTVCHSKTENIQQKTREADIVIVAVGKPKYFGKEYFREGQVVVDIGINTIFGKKLEEEVEGKILVGDVDFDSVRDIVTAITPVPGGVGPMTVLALFENVIDLCLGK